MDAKGKCRYERRPQVHIGEHNFGMLTAMEFIAWAESQHAITPESIQQRWQVSRATSYRWLASYKRVIERQQAAA